MTGRDTAEMPEARMIGDWLVIKPIGDGHFGKVYLVERNGQQGALKQALPAEDSAERLRIEADALSALSHPAIPTLLDSQMAGDLMYLVMSLAPGVTVKKRIEDWTSLGRVHGATEAVSIMQRFLEVLAYLHNENKVHRDIKDANVMIDEDNLTLLDFGFCKAAGVTGIRVDDSFWGAGAARFSPLSKLEHPAVAIPGHDVYAAGVLAYRLLTGVYPYSVEEGDDIGKLKELIKSTTLVQPHEVNSLIPLNLSRWVTALLDQSDDSRPTAEQALASLGKVYELFKNTTVTQTRRLAIPAHPHVVRDAVHGDIRLTDYEYQVLGTPQMQRLRWIKQLGLTNLVYPGAEHSRLAHSVGVVHCVETMFSAIESQSGIRIDQDTRDIARLYALTHDVTHVPWGHTIEDELGFYPRHDENHDRFLRLVGGTDSELGQLLRTTEAGRATISLLDPSQDTDDSGIAAQSVSGVIGADVLDYVDRDSLHCGLDHRVDSAIYRQIALYSRQSQSSGRVYSNAAGKYGLRVDREFAVESLLSERYALFLKVYTHSTKLAADAVVGKALQLRYRSLKESDLEWAGDESMLRAIVGGRNKGQIEQLMRLIRTRVLPRAVYRSSLLSSIRRDSQGYQDVQGELRLKKWNTPDGRASLESDLARKSGIPGDRIFVYLPLQAPGYKRTDLWQQSSGANGKPTRGETPEAANIAKRHLGLWEAWVFVMEAEERERRRVADAAEEILSRINLIERYAAAMPPLF